MRLARALAPAASFLAALFCALAAGSPAHASLIPIAQTRTASAAGSATVDGVTVADAQTKSAPGFGAWNESAGVAVRNDPATVDAFASQSSSITATQIAMSGLADAFAQTSGFDQEANGSAGTLLRLVFDVTAATAFRLDAEITRLGIGSAAFDLSGPGVAIQLDLFGNTSFHGVVPLAIGTYVLEARASASGIAAFGSSSGGRSTVDFTFSEAVPEPATSLFVFGGIAALAASRRRRARARVLHATVAFWFVAAGAGSAGATLVATAQARHVIATGGITDGLVTLGDTDQSSALDFSPFADSAAVFLDCGTARPGPCVTFVGTAAQDSRIMPTRVSMSGSAEAAADTFGSPDEANGRAQSSFRIDFDLATVTAFRFDASVTARDGGTARIRLSGPGVAIDLDADGTRSHAGALVLGPGSYALTADAFARVFAAHGGSAYGFGSVDLVLAEVPEPGPILLLGAGLAALARRGGTRWARPHAA